MRKEIRIGLGVIGILLVIFVVVAIRRISQAVLPPASIPGSDATAGALQPPDGTTGQVTRPPTIVQPKDSAGQSPSLPGDRVWSGLGAQGLSGSAQSSSAGPPRTSFLPDPPSGAPGNRFHTAASSGAFDAASQSPAALPASDAGNSAAPNHFRQSPPVGIAPASGSPSLDPNRLVPPPPLDGAQATPHSGLPAAGNERAVAASASDEPTSAGAGQVRLTGLENYPPPASMLTAGAGDYVAAQDSTGADATAPPANFPAGRWSTPATSPPPTTTVVQSPAAATTSGNTPGGEAPRLMQLPSPAATAASYPAGAYPAPAAPITTRAAAPSAAPVMPPSGIYTVEPNDNFWTIAQKVYGSGNYFKALHQHNSKRIDHPDQLRIGDKVLVPEVAELRRMYGELCPRERAAASAPPNQLRTVATSSRLSGGGRVYEVRQGDTLTDIARFELGRASRWVEIYELNRDRLAGDQDYLPVGTQLLLPANEPADRVTRNPATGAIR